LLFILFVYISRLALAGGLPPPEDFFLISRGALGVGILSVGFPPGGNDAITYLLV
jgi:hypothetical protein